MGRAESAENAERLFRGVAASEVTSLALESREVPTGRPWVRYGSIVRREVAKFCVTIEIEGVSEREVRSALDTVLGPAGMVWLQGQGHFLGVFLQILDVSEAVAYGAAWEAKETGERPAQPQLPVVHVNIVARSERALRALQVILAETIISGLRPLLRASSITLKVDE